MSGHVLVARLDRPGDVLVCGPAVRAVAAQADRVTMLVSAAGLPAAQILPAVDGYVVWDCPWIASPPPALNRADFADIVGRIGELAVDEALILTSFHQSALPTAMMLRIAGVPHIAAVSTDYPGALLDVRIGEPPDGPEPLRMLAIADAAGYRRSPDDDGSLRVAAVPRPEFPYVSPPYVVVHPGTDAPARSYPARRWHDVVTGLTAAGHRVVVTGGPAERELTAAVAVGAVAPGRAVDLGGRTDFTQLAGVLAAAEVVAVGNTAPAHLAAAVGTPVVSLFAPVVPAQRWAPHAVPTVLLGDQYAACRDTRARVCPTPGHPCLSRVAPAEVVAAVRSLAPELSEAAR